MRDINFFSSRIEARNRSMYKNMVMILLPSILLAVLVLTFGVLKYMTWTLERDKVRMNSYLNSPEVRKWKADYDVGKKKLDEATKYLGMVDGLNNQLSSAETINTDLIARINAAMTKDTVISSLSIDRTTLKISAVTGSRITASELLHNLGKLEFLENVKISAVTQRTGGAGFSFSIEATLKEAVKK